MNSQKRTWWITFAVWALAVVVAAISEERNPTLVDVLAFLICGLPIVWLFYGLSRLIVASHDPQGKEKTYRGLVKVGGWVVFFAVVALVLSFWEYYATNRTATIREVFLHPANRNLGPEVYMNDGTVWALDDAAENVHMISNDKIRYVFVPAPSETMDSPSPDACKLEDVTTGYSTEAVRLSAPFKHSSCPPGSQF